MNKTEFIKEVALISGVENIVVEHVLNVSMDVIKNTIEQGIEVSFRGFGKFYLSRIKEKKGHHFVTGEKIIIPEKKIMKFKTFRNKRKELI